MPLDPRKEALKKLMEKAKTDQFAKMSPPNLDEKGRPTREDGSTEMRPDVLKQYGVKGGENAKGDQRTLDQVQWDNTDEAKQASVEGAREPLEDAKKRKLEDLFRK